MNDPAVEFIGINTLFCEPDLPKDQKVFDSFSSERGREGVWYAAGLRRYAFSLVRLWILLAVVTISISCPYEIAFQEGTEREIFTAML